VGEVLPLARPPAVKAAKWTWLDAIAADAVAQTYPHVGRRFLSDLALELTKFRSFAGDGVYAGRLSLAGRLKVTPHQISRGLKAMETLGYLAITRRGANKTNLMVPLLDGKRLFGGGRSEPAGSVGVNHGVQREWTSRFRGSEPPGSPSLLSLESLSGESKHTVPSPTPPTHAGAQKAAADDCAVHDLNGLTAFGRIAFASGMQFIFEDSEPFRAWRAFRGEDGMPPIDVRIVGGTRRRGVWLPSFYPRGKDGREYRGG
jgi:hypothetical protein